MASAIRVFYASVLLLTIKISQSARKNAHSYCKNTIFCRNSTEALFKMLQFQIWGLFDCGALLFPTFVETTIQYYNNNIAIITSTSLSPSSSESNRFIVECVSSNGFYYRDRHNVLIEHRFLTAALIGGRRSRIILLLNEALVLRWYSFE